MNTRTLKSTASLFAVLSLALAGCVGAGDVETGAPQEEAQFTRTIVHLDADGSRTVKVVAITAAEQRADVEALARAGGHVTLEDGAEHVASAGQALSRDTSCLGSSIWLFDLPNMTGNEICFSGTGTVDLRDYGRGNGGLWARNVVSFWAGTRAGSLGKDSTSNTCWSHCTSSTCYPYCLYDQSVVKSFIQYQQDTNLETEFGAPNFEYTNITWLNIYTWTGLADGT